jgi:hypothetical protein
MQVQARTLDDIFAHLTDEQRSAAFGNGVAVTTEEDPTEAVLVVREGAGVDLTSSVLAKTPAILFESIRVIPKSGAAWERNPALAIYNAFGQVSALAGRLYHSVTRDKDVPLFEEASLLESEKRSSEIPDRAPALSVPASDTWLLKLDDINFGNSYYRADLLDSGGGRLTYRLTNFRTISYAIFSVIKKEDFNSMMYFEMLDEGLLMYCVTGVRVPSFAASMIHVPSAIEKRLAVIHGWILDELRGKR